MSEYLTVQEAAKELRVTTRSVYAWLRDGKLRGERAGNRWRITWDDLARFTRTDRGEPVRTILHPCPVCGAATRMQELCWYFGGPGADSFTVKLVCDSEEAHPSQVAITEEQYERARRGDWAFLWGDLRREV